MDGAKKGGDGWKAEGGGSPQVGGSSFTEEGAEEGVVGVTAATSTGEAATKATDVVRTAGTGAAILRQQRKWAAPF